MRSTSDEVSFAAMQASRCLQLARECSDAEISYRLCELARAFADYADRKGAERQCRQDGRCLVYPRRRLH